MCDLVMTISYILFLVYAKDAGPYAMTGTNELVQ